MNSEILLEEMLNRVFVLGMKGTEFHLQEAYIDRNISLFEGDGLFLWGFDIGDAETRERYFQMFEDIYLRRNEFEYTEMSAGRSFGYIAYRVKLLKKDKN